MTDFAPLLEMDPVDGMERALSIMRIQLEAMQGIRRITQGTLVSDNLDEETVELLSALSASHTEMLAALVDVLDATELAWEIAGHSPEAAAAYLPEVIRGLECTDQLMQTIQGASGDDE